MALRRLRADLAATYEGVNPDQILVTTGAIEANYLLVNTLLEAGDHVVSVFPAYQQLYSVAKAVGCDISLWNIVNDGGNYRFDLDELERLVKPETKMILINTPNNPTGALLSDDELKRVYALAESVDAYVLSDEAYRWLDVPGGEPLAAPMRNLGPRAISVGTFSKPFGLPGLRIGWIAATEEIIKGCWSARDYVSLAPGGISDFLASIALRERDKIVKRNQDIMRQNLDYAEGWFAKHGELASWNVPRGGLLALLKYNRGSSLRSGGKHPRAGLLGHAGARFDLRLRRASPHWYWPIAGDLCGRTGAHRPLPGAIDVAANCQRGVSLTVWCKLLPDPNRASCPSQWPILSFARLI